MKKFFDNVQMLKSSENCDKYSKSVSYETLVGGTTTIGTGIKQTRRLSKGSADKPLTAVGTLTSLLCNSAKVMALSFLRLRGASGAQGISTQASCREAHKRRFLFNSWIIHFAFAPFRMTLFAPALALLFTLATTTESQAGTISCVNGKYADGTDCQSCGSDCNWSYDTENKHLDVFGSGDMYDYIQHSGGAYLAINGQEIPWRHKIISSLSITGLNTVGRNAFIEQRQLKELTLDKTITELHPGAFQNTGLENVTLSDSITDLGFYAFRGSSLKEITLADSIITIEQGAIVGTNNTNIVCKGADCEDIKTKLQASRYTGKFSIAKDEQCNDANYYYTGLACIKEPDVTKRTCEYERTGYIKVGDYCASPEVTYAKKHYTPAEANQWLKDDDNFVVLTFKK